MNNNIIQYKEGEWTGLELPEDIKSGVQVILVFADRFIVEEGVVLQQLKSHFSNAEIITCSSAGEINNRVAEEIQQFVLLFSLKKPALLYQKAISMIMAIFMN